jgi:hypothetical protein
MAAFHKDRKKMRQPTYRATLIAAFLLWALWLAWPAAADDDAGALVQVDEAEVRAQVVNRNLRMAPQLNDLNFERSGDGNLPFLERVHKVEMRMVLPAPANDKATGPEILILRFEPGSLEALWRSQPSPVSVTK